MQIFSVFRILRNGKHFTGNNFSNMPATENIQNSSADVESESQVYHSTQEQVEVQTKLYLASTN